MTRKHDPSIPRSVDPSICLSADPSILDLHVQPRAGKTEVAGWHGDAIKIRIAAPPVDGAANAELVRFLAERLGVPRGAVNLTSGTNSRRKRVAVAGLDRRQVLERLGMDVRPET